MSKSPLMPMATALWLVENTTLTFKQIAEFCKIHEVEVQGIADGEVAKGIKPYNPIMAGQLTREEIDLSSKDENKDDKLYNFGLESINKDFVEIVDFYTNKSSESVLVYATVNGDQSVDDVFQEIQNHI